MRLVLAEVAVDAGEVKGILTKPAFAPLFRVLGRRGRRADLCLLLATPKGFEPSISTVTGWHVRPLHHGAARDVEPAATRTRDRRASLILALRLAAVNESICLPPSLWLARWAAIIAASLARDCGPEE